MTEFILHYWIEVLFGIIVAGFGVGYRRLVEKMKAGDRKQEAIEKGIQALLRDRIIKAYNHYLEQGYCPIYGLENVEALYKQYHALGGNGTVTGLIEKLRELPTTKEGE